MVGCDCRAVEVVVEEVAEGELVLVTPVEIRRW